MLMFAGRRALTGVGLVVLLLLAACDAGAPTATPFVPTPSLPAATPLLPTETPPPAPTLAATDTPEPAPPTDTPAPPPTATRPPARTPTPAGKAVAVNIIDFDFSPKVITVTVGTTIVWTNKGATIHTVASRTQKLFSSEVLNSGDRFSWTPTAPGTIPYWCTIHPDMLGTIIVVAKK